MQILSIIKIIVFLSVCFFLFLSCNKSPNANQLELIWERRLSDEPVLSTDPIIYKDVVIYVHEILSDDCPLYGPQIFKAFDKRTGELRWTWERLLRENECSERLHHIQPRYLVNNILYFHSRNEKTYALDLDTQTLLWEYEHPYGVLVFILHGLNDDLFTVSLTGKEQKWGRHPLQVERASIRDGVFSSFFSLPDTAHDNFYYSLHAYENRRGDPMLAIGTVEDYADTTTRNDYPWLYLVNMDNGKVDRKIELNPKRYGDDYSLVPEIKYYEGYLYVSESDHMIKIDTESGNIIWKTQIQGDVVASGFIINEEGLFLKAQAAAHALDPETGKILWTNDKIVVGLGGTSVYHHGVFYYALKGLWALDAFTGKVLVHTPEPRASYDDFFPGELSYDPETGYLYVFSYTTAYCYRPYR